MRHATQVGEVVSAINGMRYRHVDDAEEALGAHGDYVESDAVPFAGYRDGSFYVIEFEARGYPDIDQGSGPLLAEWVTRVFYDPSDGSGETDLDLRLLRWMFPRAEFVSVEPRQHDDEEVYVVTSVGLPDSLTPLSLTEYKSILNAPVSMQVYDFLPFLRLRFGKWLRPDITAARLEYRRYRSDDCDEIFLVLVGSDERGEERVAHHPLDVKTRKPFHEFIIDCSRMDGMAWIHGEEVAELFSPEGQERVLRGR